VNSLAKIVFDNISHSYDKGKNWALKDINMTFPDKSRNGLLGPSGCGKTTLLKIICGLEKPSTGKVYFDDQDVTEMTPEERNIAIVFQFPVVYNLTVYNNLMFPLMNTKQSKEEKDKKVMKVADAFGLKNILNRQATSLGPADRQRVALSRVLVREPRAFLFDEPLSSIEPENKPALKAEIKHVQETLGQTTVYVTHDQTEALTFAENIAIMDVGKVAQFDSVEKIYAKPASTFVSYFIGSPGMNLIDGTLKGNKVDFSDFTIDLPSSWKIPSNITEVKLGIRPEHLVISQEKKAGWTPFTVDLFEEQGKGFGIATLASDHIQIKGRSSILLEEGTKAWVSFPAQYLHLFDKEGKRIVD